MRECQQKKRDKIKQEEEKKLIQQIAEVAERSCLDSWPRTLQEESKDQRDIVKVYQVMTGMFEDEIME